MTDEYKAWADINITKHDDSEVKSWVKENVKTPFYIRPDTFDRYGDHHTVRRIYFEDKEAAQTVQDRYPL
jgi:hypothetical protein